MRWLQKVWTDPVSFGDLVLYVALFIVAKSFFENVWPA
jgi:hypothetical protein